MPTVQQLETAAAWLDVNEGTDGEADDCAAVAQWLMHQARMLADRDIAREAGVPVRHVRRAIAELERTP